MSELTITFAFISTKNEDVNLEKTVVYTNPYDLPELMDEFVAEYKEFADRMFPDGEYYLGYDFEDVPDNFNGYSFNAFLSALVTRFN